MSEKRLTTIELMGQSVSLYTDLSDEKLARVVSLAMQTLTDVAEKAKSPLTHKTALLAMLSIAEKHVDLSDQFNEFKIETQTRSERVLKTLEDIVPPTTE